MNELTNLIKIAKEQSQKIEILQRIRMNDLDEISNYIIEHEKTMEEISKKIKELHDRIKKQEEKED